MDCNSSEMDKPKETGEYMFKGNIFSSQKELDKYMRENVSPDEKIQFLPYEKSDLDEKHPLVHPTVCNKHNTTFLFSDKCPECEVDELKGSTGNDIWTTVAFCHTRINKLSSNNIKLEKAVKILSGWVKNVEEKNASLKRLLKDVTK